MKTWARVQNSIVDKESRNVLRALISIHEAVQNQETEGNQDRLSIEGGNLKLSYFPLGKTRVWCLLLASEP